MQYVNKEISRNFIFLQTETINNSKKHSENLARKVLYIFHDLGLHVRIANRECRRKKIFVFKCINDVESYNI